MLPLLLQLIKVLVIEGASFNWAGQIIVDFSSPVELVGKPFPLVGQFSIGVVEPAHPMHVVISPFSIVEAAFLVIKFAPSIPHPIFLISFISAAIFVLLDHILAFLVGFGRLRSLTNFGDRAERIPAWSFLRGYPDAIVIVFRSRKRILLGLP